MSILNPKNKHLFFFLSCDIHFKKNHSRTTRSSRRKKPVKMASVNIIQCAKCGNSEEKACHPCWDGDKWYCSPSCHFLRDRVQSSFSTGQGEPLKKASEPCSFLFLGEIWERSRLASGDLIQLKTESGTYSELWRTPQKPESYYRYGYE